jgi:hypothetical protein
VRVAALLLPVAWLAAPAGAAAGRNALVDSVEIYGDADAADVRGFVGRVVAGAGLAASFSRDGAAACGPDTACLRRRASVAGAEIVLRVIVLDIAGQVSVELYAVRVADGQAWRHAASGVDLDAGDERLSTALAGGLGARPSGRGRRVAAWSLTGTAAGFALGGGLALYRAYALRRDFLDQHTDEMGDVVGISVSTAEQAEDRARRWALAGSLLLAGAGVTGVTATVLFITGPDERAEPAGLAIEGRF